MLLIFHNYFRDLPRKPMGKLLRDVYERGLTGGIYNTREYRQTYIALFKLFIEGRKCIHSILIMKSPIGYT